MATTRRARIAGLVLGTGVCVVGCSGGKPAPVFEPLDPGLLAPPKTPAPAPGTFAAPAAERAVHAGHAGEVKAIAFSPDGEWLVSAGATDQTIRVWATGDAAEGEMRRPAAHVIGLAFAPAGDLLVAGNLSGSLTFWPFADGQLGEPVEGSERVGSQARVAVSRNGKLLATASFDKTLTLWDLAARKLLRRVTLPVGLCAVALAPSGRALAAAGEGNAFFLWDLTTGTGTAHAVSKVEGAAWCYGLDWSPDGKQIATGHNETTMSLWDVAGQRETRNWFHANAAVMALAWSPDGRILATAQHGIGVMLWDPGTGDVRGMLGWPGGSVHALAFSPDGTRLAGAGSDGKIRIWGG